MTWLLVVLGVATVILVVMRLFMLRGRSARLRRPRHSAVAAPAVPAAPNLPRPGGSPVRFVRTAAKASGTAERHVPVKEVGALVEPGLRIGRELGHGGQAAVYEVVGDADVVYKKYFVPRRDTAELLDLIGSGSLVRERLADLGVDLVWPQRMVEGDGVVRGVVMPRVPARYSAEFTGPGRVDQRLLTLDHAIPRPSAVYRMIAEVSDDDRLAIVRLIGHFLEALHREDLVYGDLSWRNILFSNSPSPGVLALDLDGVGRIGTRMISAHTPDWTDPLSTSSGLVDGFDVDRFKFALLAYRMLVAKSLDARLPAALGDELIAGLSPTGSRGVAWLLGRAAGAAGTRPQITEWLDVLDDPDRHALPVAQGSE